MSQQLAALQTHTTDTHYRHTLQTHTTDTHYKHALQTRTTDTHYRHTLQTRTTDTHYRHTLQTHTTDTFLFITHTKNVLLFKFRCNIFISVRIIKEMPGSVSNGTPCISSAAVCVDQWCAACGPLPFPKWPMEPFASQNFNLLKPDDIYICRTAALTSRRYILNINSTNIHPEYFKHAA